MEDAEEEAKAQRQRLEAAEIFAFIFPLLDRMLLIDARRLPEHPSQAWVVALPPSWAISASTRASFSALRPTRATAASRLASSCAVQRPMPLPPPVTITTCPENGSGRKIDR